MAGAFTRLNVVIEGIQFADQGGFADVMARFYEFLDVQFGIRPVAAPPPRSAPKPKQPRAENWRKTLGFSSDQVVGVAEIEHAFRELVKKLRPDRLVHGVNQKKRDRWNRVLAAREMALKEVTR